MEGAYSILSHRASLPLAAQLAIFHSFFLFTDCTVSDAKTDKDKDSLSKGGSKAKDKEKNDNFRIPTEAENQIPRFEKVMRRMDSDGDGKHRMASTVW